MLKRTALLAALLFASLLVLAFGGTKPQLNVHATGTTSSSAWCGSQWVWLDLTVQGTIAGHGLKGKITGDFVGGGSGQRWGEWINDNIFKNHTVYNWYAEGTASDGRYVLVYGRSSSDGTYNKQTHSGTSQGTFTGEMTIGDGSYQLSGKTLSHWTTDDSGCREGGSGLITSEGRFTFTGKATSS